METQKNARTFERLINAYVKRDGINELMAWLGNTDFYEAPASTRFHGSEEGGLCQHSLNVGTWLFKLADSICPGEYSKETLTIVSLFHDLCKCNCYVVDSKNVKNETTGRWEKVPYFKWEEQQCYGGHGDKSVFLIMQFMKLTFEEAAAINTHMGRDGSANPNAVSDCYNANKLAWLLHVADEAATYIDKC